MSYNKTFMSDAIQVSETDEDKWVMMDEIYSEILLNDDKFLEGLCNIINIILGTAITWTDHVKTRGKERRS